MPGKAAVLAGATLGPRTVVRAQAVCGEQGDADDAAFVRGASGLDTTRRRSVAKAARARGRRLLCGIHCTALAPPGACASSSFVAAMSWKECGSAILPGERSTGSSSSASIGSAAAACAAAARVACQVAWRVQPPLVVRVWPHPSTWQVAGNVGYVRPLAGCEEGPPPSDGAGRALGARVARGWGTGGSPARGACWGGGGRVTASKWSLPSNAMTRGGRTPRTRGGKVEPGDTPRRGARHRFRCYAKPRGRQGART